MEVKKISFGFSKISKKVNLLPTKESSKTETKVELIKCLEGQEIKLVEEKPEEMPLTIPLKNSQKTSTALASLMKRRAVLLGEDEQKESNVITEVKTSKTDDGPEDIEKRAARELLAEVQKNNSTDPENSLIVTVATADQLPLDGAKESTLDDYESIPIEDFGKAMLRGMGWIEPLEKTCKKRGPPADDAPVVRPKGMGLGADKALSKKSILIAPEANEVLEIKRNAFVRILGGKHKDLYGQIEGFDEHKGRVIVKLAIGGAKESFNEFLCQPVSRKEFSQYGKCINSSKYEEYKKKENEYGQIILDKDSKDCKGNEDLKQYKEYKRNSNYDHEQKVKQETASTKKEEIYRRPTDYEDKNKTVKDEYRKQKYHKSDVKGYRNHYESSRDEVSYYSRDNKNDYHKEEKYRSLKNSERSKHKDRDGQSRSGRFQYYSDDSSDSESVSYHSSKSKPHSKKKSKKSKSKYKDSSTDTQSTSTDTSPDNREVRTKKHKKRTKKSKKQRERSRSRGRR